MKRLRASSLVLVLVVITGIIIVVFGASRLTLVQYNQSNRDEDNIFALYAAKAGIEDGLLRFRYNRNAETQLNTTDDPKDKVSRYNLTTGSSAGEVNEGSTTPNFAKPTDQYYDMKLNFRVQSIGDFDFSPKSIIAKDDFLEISGFEQKNNPYYLRVAFHFYEPGSNGNIDCSDRTKALVQMQRVVEGATEPYRQFTAKPNNGGVVYDSMNSDANIEVDPISSSQLTATFRFRPYYCDVAYALATTMATNGRGVDNNGAAIPNDSGPLFGGLKSYVTSTGYYGAAKRTLIGEIDRISGQLISIYDFNLYSGEGNIKPQ
ncbi:MAG: hypothetical protein NUV80_07230 [Candidatus Berkelbacteria bacterium]|nr:hypothetical protein [Candidatus Berkelbacteria bacterium]